MEGRGRDEKFRREGAEEEDGSKCVIRGGGERDIGGDPGYRGIRGDERGRPVSVR